MIRSVVTIFVCAALALWGWLWFTDKGILVKSGGAGKPPAVLECRYLIGVETYEVHFHYSANGIFGKPRCPTTMLLN